MAVIYLPKVDQPFVSTRLDQLNIFQSTLESFTPFIREEMERQSSDRRLVIPIHENGQAYALGDYHNFQPHSTGVANEASFLLRGFAERLPLVFSSFDLERRIIALFHHGLWHDFKIFNIPFFQEAIELPAPVFKIMRWVIENEFPLRIIELVSSTGLKGYAGAMLEDRVSSEAYSALSLANKMLQANTNCGPIFFPQDITDAYTNIVGGTQVIWDQSSGTVYTPYLRRVLSAGFLGSPTTKPQEIPEEKLLTYTTPNLIARLEMLAMSYADVGLVLQNPKEAVRQSIALFVERILTNPPKEFPKLGEYLKAWSDNQLPEEKRELTGKYFVEYLLAHLWNQLDFIDGRKILAEEELRRAFKNLKEIQAFMCLRYRFGGNTKQIMENLFLSIENQPFSKVLEILAEEGIIDIV